jgi:hypothetical protein
MQDKESKHLLLTHGCNSRTTNTLIYTMVPTHAAAAAAVAAEQQSQLAALPQQVGWVDNTLHTTCR